jgi:hypothetical protein
MILNTGRRSSTQKHNPRRIIQVSLHSLTHYHPFPFYSFILFVIYFLSCSSPTFLLITYFVPILFVSKLLSPPPLLISSFRFIFSRLRVSFLLTLIISYLLPVYIFFIFLFIYYYHQILSSMFFFVYFCYLLIHQHMLKFKKKIILTPSNNIQS